MATSTIPLVAPALAASPSETLERFELVSSPRTRVIADMFLAVAAHAKIDATTLRDTIVDGEVLEETVKSTKHGPYLPVLYDNAHMFQCNQAVTALHYLSSNGAAAALSGDALRSMYAAEAAIRFAREHPLTGSNPPADVIVTQRARATEQMQMLQRILGQRTPGVSGSGSAITAGDLAAYVFVKHACNVYGDSILASSGSLAALVKALDSTPQLASLKLSYRTTSTAAAASAAASSVPRAPVAASAGAPVLVTGASGYIASWIVRMLLERGEFVHATVRSLAATARYEHLTSMPRADTNLKMFEADLLVPGSFDVAAAGCSGIYHCASPYIAAKSDPYQELIRPAVEGTQNVLRTALRTVSVRRVVMTSSVAAVYVSRKRVDHFYTEEDWSDVEYIREMKQHYAESKLLAEQEAWRIMKEETPAGRRVDLITMCPTQCIGPLLQPEVSMSTSSILELLAGDKKVIPNKGKCFVDVRDVAAAHIAGMNVPGATGRYVLIATSIPWATACDVLRRTLPSARVPTEVEAGPACYPQALASIRKVFELGVAYMPVETSLRDCALSLYAKGFLSHVIPPAKE